MPKRDLLLYVDNSDESVRIHRDLEQQGVDFRLVYSSGTRHSVPAIESQHGIVRGYDNIRRYLIPTKVTETPNTNCSD